MPEHEIHRPTDEDDVAQRPDARPLPERDPEQQDDDAHEDRPRPDRERRVAREPLVKYVPRVEAETGEHEQRRADAIEDEAAGQLSET